MLLTLVFCSATAKSQTDDRDICILEHLNVTQISGRVVAAPSTGQAEQPLPGAVVELRYIGQQQVIAKTLTDEKGHFVLRNLVIGNYSLAAKPPTSQRLVLFATAVEVRLRNSTLAGKQGKEIVLALGWELGGCHGGYAQVRKKSK